MATLHVSSSEPATGATGNAGTQLDPMGLDEAFIAAVAGDTILIADDGIYTPTISVAPISDGTLTDMIKVIGTNSSWVEDGSRPFIDGGAFHVIWGGVRTYWHYKNLIVDSNHSGRGCFYQVYYSIIENCSNQGGICHALVYLSLNTLVIDCHSVNGWCVSSSLAEVHAIRCSSDGGSGCILSGSSATSRSGTIIDSCYAKNATLVGFDVRPVIDGAATITNTIADGCPVGFEVDMGVGGQLLIDGCIAYNNTGSGFEITDPTPALRPGMAWKNCIAFNNGGYGFDLSTLGAGSMMLSNCYGYLNTSGLLNGTASIDGHTATALTADPFNDAAAGDFTINDASGGGSVLRAVLESAAGPESYPFRRLVASLGGGAATTVGYFG